MNSEITTAWKNCLAAAERYGDYVSALNNIDVDISAANTPSSSGNSSNVVVGNIGNSAVPTKGEGIRAAVLRMKANSAQWPSASGSKKEALYAENIRIANEELTKYGVNANIDKDGVWRLADGRELYKVYQVLHRGGIAGNHPTLKQNEVMAILEKGEPVLDAQKEKGLYRLIDFTSVLSEKLGKAFKSVNLSNILDILKNGADSTHAPLPSVTNNQTDTVHFGDVYIYGANDETVKQHQEINRQFTNEVLSQLRIKR